MARLCCQKFFYLQEWENNEIFHINNLDEIAVLKVFQEYRFKPVVPILKVRRPPIYTLEKKYGY
jgi:hypothetical protein